MSRVSSLWLRLRPEAPFVAIVVALSVVGQWLVLHHGPNPIISSDSTIYYLADAHAITSTQGLIDPKVPPGYPLFLAAVFAVAGRDNLEAVVVAQAFLLVVALTELYALLVAASLPRWAATVAAGSLAASPWLAQWERFVLAEALSFVALVTLLLLVVLMVNRPSSGLAVACGLAAAAGPFMRPALVAVPASVVAVLLARWLVRRRRAMAGERLAPLVIVAVLAYLPVGAYVIGNVIVNHCGCYTNIGNINLFGKIYEYGMESFPADPQHSNIAAQVRATNNVNDFLANHPEYKAANYAPLADFARSQFLRYPGFTLRKTLREIQHLLTLQIDYSTYAPTLHACQGAPGTLVTGDAVVPEFQPCVPYVNTIDRRADAMNTIVYTPVFLGYALLPVELVLGAVLALRRPERNRAWLLLMASAMASAVIVVSAVAGYEAFDRLRLPADGVAVATFAIFVAEMTWVVRELRHTFASSARVAEAGHPAG